MSNSRVKGLTSSFSEMTIEDCGANDNKTLPALTPIKFPFRVFVLPFVNSDILNEIYSYCMPSTIFLEICYVAYCTRRPK